MSCWALLTGAALLAPACSVGPKYSRPGAPVPPAYKEPPPASIQGQWKPSEPKDDTHRGNWWEVFQDQQLNALEEQINPSNQTLAAAEARFRAARAAVRSARAALYPVITGGTSITGSQPSATRSATRLFPTPAAADLQIPFDSSYEADVWERIHRTIAANIRNAQASAADLETVRLSLQAELAVDYFQLRGLDAERQLLESTVSAYQKALELTRNRYDQGVASGVDVVQAQTQLETTRAQATDTDVLRSQFEHAIAILAGKAPSELSISRSPLTLPPPVIPVGLPSELLERRPDVASAERLVAAANEQIGIAKSAFYPSVTLGIAAGLESSNLVDLFAWPSRFWSLGPSLVQTVFDAGKRKAVSEQAQALYDASVAAYRQTVLGAFQEVEDNLAALRILDQEDKEQTDAVRFAERSLALANNRYQGGITTYLEVITAQSAALANQRTAVGILTRRMAASVLLIKALGGGWDASSLPSDQQLMNK
jgi:NodT family efflux transporter outer membrane factor (OMF) lipoprotein